MRINPFGSGRIFVISRPKFGVLEHVGLHFSDNTVLHATPPRGTHRSTVEEFADGQDVRIVREIPPELHWLVHQRANWIERNPRRYDALMFNCVHFVHWLIGTGETQAVSHPLSS